MAQRLEAEDHIEQFFRTHKQEACAIQRDKIDLIMRVRFPDLAPVKRGRKSKVKTEPPISVKAKTGSPSNAAALKDEVA